MKREYDDDLFQDSTMTFGEHLEELRACLFRAAIGLAIGFLIGLAVSKQVVEIIKAPMERALMKDIALRDEERFLEQLKASGVDVPDNWQKDPQYQVLKDNGLTFRQVYFDIDQVVAALKEINPNFTWDPPDAPSEPADDSQATDETVEAETKELVSVRMMVPLDRDPRTQFTFLSGQEPFIILIKAAFVAGLVISSPWVFYQIWSFVAAGLYPHEKHFVNVFLPFSLGLFLLGASTAYIFVFDPVLDFLFGIGRWLGFRPEMRISEWLSLVLFLPLGFGISFQLPLVMLFLERIGVFDLGVYMSQWRVAVLVICIISMLATPADPYSMLLLAGPLTILYGGGIALCKFLPRSDDYETDDDLD